MRRDEIRELFRDYVFGFIQSDIEREIWLARKAEHDEAHGMYPGPHPGGGNVLAALGLLCYTEFLGSLEGGRGTSDEKKFTTFLYRMGRTYQSFDETLRKDTRQKSVWNVFRNGLVHEYFVKRNCTIYMQRGAENCGIGALDDGRYFFVVERYLADLIEAARKLQDDLLARAVP